MNIEEPTRQPATRKPFVKMQIEKVNLRTAETMGEYCQRLSSTTAQGHADPSCSVPAAGCNM